MKIDERLYIGNQEAKPYDVLCKLSYRNPGTAKIITNIEPTMKQIIAYECGYNKKLTRYFMGYVESWKETNNQEFALFCREFSASLRNPLTLAMQHPTLIDVLDKITEITGLKFIVPGKDYAKTPTPYIISQSTGYALLDLLGEAFNIERYVWQQQGDGSIFIGSWYDSLWYGKNIPVPFQLLTNTDINTTTIPLNPMLRPGVIVNGERIREITLHKEKMHITWMTK